MEALTCLLGVESSCLRRKTFDREHTYRGRWGSAVCGALAVWQSPLDHNAVIQQGILHLAIMSKSSDSDFTYKKCFPRHAYVDHRSSVMRSKNMKHVPPLHQVTIDVSLPKDVSLSHVLYAASSKTGSLQACDSGWKPGFSMLRKRANLALFMVSSNIKAMCPGTYQGQQVGRAEGCNDVNIAEG